MELWLARDDYKKILAKIHGASKLIQRMLKDYVLKIRSVRKLESISVKEVLDRIDRLRKEAYGRISSVIKSLNSELHKLADITRRMKKLPDYNPDLPTIVVAGPPNSGKSSLVKKLSNAKVEIAAYPFTTKNITFGHIELREGITARKIQIVDTPGLFDRPLEERKEPELLALKAIQTIADIIVFLFDGSIEAVMESTEQINVFKVVQKVFKENRPMIIAINKVDVIDESLVFDILKRISHEANEVLKISVKTGYNIDELLKKIKMVSGSI